MHIPRPEFRLIDTHTPPRVQLTKDYRITLDDGAVIVVPIKFITDLASIPRLFWAIPGFSPLGPLAYGAIVHDFGYQYGYLLAEVSSIHLELPEASKYLIQKYADKFKTLVPVFVGRRQEFFDVLLAGITKEATKAYFIATVAKEALAWFGDRAWNQYRAKGPAAYYANSLGLPGLTIGGYKL